MKKIMNYVGYLFLMLLASCVVALVLYAQELPVDSMATLSSKENAELYRTIISALGGFSGGGLLLMFLIRRLVNSYDANFNKVENRCHTHTQSQDDKNNKIIDMIENVRDITQDLKLEIIKLQATTVDKDSILEVITKVAMFEADVNQVKSEVKSIMTHLSMQKMSF